MKNDFPLLQLMIQDQAKQKAIYKPGEYWQGYQNRTVEAIKKHGIEDFRKHAEIGKGYSDTITRDPFQLAENPKSTKMRIAKWMVNLPKIKNIIQLYTSLHRSSLYELNHYKQ